MAARRGSNIDVRRLVQAAWDGLAWIIVIPLAVTLRFDSVPAAQVLQAALWLGLCLGIVQILLGYLIQAVRGREIIGTFDDAVMVTTSLAVVAVFGTAFVFLQNPPPVPRSLPLIAGAFVVGLLLGGRFFLRAYRQRSFYTTAGERVLIYGAGNTGEQIVRQVLLTAGSKFTAVGLLDDNPRKCDLRIQGVRVLGSSDDLEKIVYDTRASTLVVAIAGASSKRLLALDRRTTALNISLRVIPTTSEIVGDAVKLGDITHASEEDLLGCRAIQTDEASIAEFLAGKRMVITGAGGSIGSELARQVHRYAPSSVGILDRDESAIHAVQLSIDGQGLLASDDPILADIRDHARMTEIMQQIRSDIVFHAAALKHVPLLERFPDECHKTKVFGTELVLQAAQASGTYAFINISTDKAADPIKVLGQTKLMAERLTAVTQQYLTALRPCRYLSVRFDNVLGSRGSVLTAFRYQIEKGGPVTVTDPNVTRNFVTIPEAVHLVLQAAVIGDHGETLILDMGDPVCILDVAKQTIVKSGREIDIVFTGLRPGEKIAEVLMSHDEKEARPKHPLISHTRFYPVTSPIV